MGKLVNFFENNRRLFIVRKHQNGSKQEKYRAMVIRSFLAYCESNNIYHTNQVTSSLARKFLSEYLKNYSAESRRQYSLVLRHFFKRFLKKEINL